MSPPITILEKHKETTTLEKPGVKHEIIDWGPHSELVEMFSANHKQRKLVVKEVLESWEPATNNDRLLDLECLRTEFEEIEVTTDAEYVTFKIPKDLIKKLPSPETYTRARRALNKQGIGLPSQKKVQLSRGQMEKAVREHFRFKEEIVKAPTTKIFPSFFGLGMAPLLTAYGAIKKNSENVVIYHSICAKCSQNFTKVLKRQKLCEKCNPRLKFYTEKEPKGKWKGKKKQPPKKQNH